jgi:hypothetical protein
MGHERSKEDKNEKELKFFFVVELDTPCLHVWWFRNTCCDGIWIDALHQNKTKKKAISLHVCV